MVYSHKEFYKPWLLQSIAIAVSGAVEPERRILVSMWSLGSLFSTCPGKKYERVHYGRAEPPALKDVL